MVRQWHHLPAQLFGTAGPQAVDTAKMLPHRGSSHGGTRATDDHRLIDLCSAVSACVPPTCICQLNHPQLIVAPPPTPLPATNRLLTNRPGFPQNQASAAPPITGQVRKRQENYRKTFPSWAGLTQPDKLLRLRRSFSPPTKSPTPVWQRASPIEAPPSHQFRAVDSQPGRVRAPISALLCHLDEPLLYQQAWQLKRA
jgi:hypothetical protein